MSRKRLAVLCSGNGTNLQALLDASADPSYPAEVALVIADRDGTGAVERATAAGVPSVVIKLDDYPDRSAFTRACIDACRDAPVDHVVSAGWLKLFSPEIFAEYPHILNIHPALLPSFPGYAKKVLRDTLEYGVKVTGATVHFLDDGVDTGPIVLQQAVPVEEADTPESLHHRIQHEEHRLLVEAVRLQALDRLHVDGRRVRIESGA